MEISKQKKFRGQTPGEPNRVEHNQKSKSRLCVKREILNRSFNAPNQRFECLGCILSHASFRSPHSRVLRANIGNLAPRPIAKLFWCMIILNKTLAEFILAQACQGYRRMSWTRYCDIADCGFLEDSTTKRGKIPFRWAEGFCALTFAAKSIP